MDISSVSETRVLKNVETDESHFFNLGFHFGPWSNNACLQYTVTFKKTLTSNGGLS